MTRPKKLILSIVISFILIIISSFCVTSMINIFAGNNSAQSEKNVSYEYILKSYDGKIAVYSAKNNSLEKVYNIYINTLPQQDIDMLNKGIKIKDSKELKSYIQDFDS